MHDDASEAILRRNFAEEITHVAAGVKWFQYLCEREGLQAESVFHEKFPTYFKGNMKDVNVTARTEAGMPIEWLRPFME